MLKDNLGKKGDQTLRKTVTPIKNANITANKKSASCLQVTEF
jgi:hypothetical protein